MFVLVAKEAMKSKYKPDVYVSTESQKIIHICKKYNLNYLKRPKKLAKDHVEKQDVIAHATRKLQKKINPRIVISLQPNTPEFCSKDLDNAIYFFNTKVFPNRPIRELITIGKDNLQDGAFRIMTTKTVFQKTLSTKVGIYFTNYQDIHYKKEFLNVKKKIEKN